MAVLPIRLFPDIILRRHSQPVRKIDREIRKFLIDLIETLYAQPGGIGIAAPQVGESKRIIVVDVSPRDPSKKRHVLMNPTILQTVGEMLCREGCMSLPDYTANVKRAEKVYVEWTDEKGERRRKWAAGIESICLQHEVDHLNGTLFLDRVASLKTDVFPRKKGRL